MLSQLCSCAPRPHHAGCTHAPFAFIPPAQLMRNTPAHFALSSAAAITATCEPMLFPMRTTGRDACAGRQRWSEGQEARVTEA